MSLAYVLANDLNHELTLADRRLREAFQAFRAAPSASHASASIELGNAAHAYMEARLAFDACTHDDTADGYCQLCGNKVTP